MMRCPLAKVCAGARAAALTPPTLATGTPARPGDACIAPLLWQVVPMLAREQLDAAIDVALFRICFIGGWSIRSAAVHDYIDATCPATPACRRFFGWLTRQ